MNPAIVSLRNLTALLTRKVLVQIVVIADVGRRRPETGARVLRREIGERLVLASKRQCADAGFLDADKRLPSELATALSQHTVVWDGSRPRS